MRTCEILVCYFVLCHKAILGINREELSIWAENMFASSGHCFHVFLDHVHSQEAQAPFVRNALGLGADQAGRLCNRCIAGEPTVLCGMPASKGKKPGSRAGWLVGVGW